MSADMLAGEIPKVILDPAQGLLYCEPKVDILKSAGYTNICTFPANTYSNSQFTVNVQVPSTTMLVGRKIALEMEATFTFAGDAGAGNVLLPCGAVAAPAPGADTALYNVKFGGGFGMRANPLSSVCSNIQCQINNQNVNGEVFRYINALLLTFDDETRKSLSGSGNNPDNAYEYFQRKGTSTTPLGDGNSVYEQCRGNMQYTVTLNTRTNATMRVKWYEYVMISPFLWSKISDNSKFLVGINQLNFIFTLTNLSYMMSIDYGSDSLKPVPVDTTVGAINAALLNKAKITGVNLSKPTMLITLLTPDLDHFGPLPNTISYDYNEITNYTTDLGATVVNTFNQYVGGNPPGTVQAQSNSIQLGVVPRYLIVFVSKNVSQRSGNYPALQPPSNAGSNQVYYGPALTDSYMCIENINIQWNGLSALLGSANGFSLYEMSRRNGLNVKWIDWQQNGQSIVVIDMARDVCSPLPVSSACQANLQINLTLRNSSPMTSQYPSNPAGPNPVIQSFNNYDWTINVLTVNEKQLKITPNGTTIAGSFPPGQFFNSLVNGQTAKYEIDFDAYERHVIGGSFWTNLRDKVRNVASQIHQYLPQIKQGFNDYVAPFLSERTAQGINNIADLADRWLPQLIASGVDKQTIMRTFQPHVPLQRLEQIYDDHIRQGGNVVGGKKVAKSRLRRF